MHVAFGRVRRKSRIGADYTDYADFGDFCLPSVFVRRGGGMGTLPVSERKLESLRYKLAVPSLAVGGRG